MGPDDIGKMERQGQGIGLGREKMHLFCFLLLSTNEAGEFDCRPKPGQSQIKAKHPAGKLRVEKASRPADATADVNDAGRRLNSGEASQHAGGINSSGMRLVVRIKVLRADMRHVQPFAPQVSEDGLRVWPTGVVLLQGCSKLFHGFVRKNAAIIRFQGKSEETNDL